MTLTTMPSAGGGSTFSYTSPNPGIVINNVVGTITLGELDWGTLDGVGFTFGTLAAGNFLYYNGTAWINQLLVAGAGIGVSGATITNSGVRTLGSANTGITVSASTGAVSLTLNELSWGILGGQTITITALAANQFLYWNGSTAWVNSAELDHFKLDGIAFSFTALASGDVLFYNGTNWTNGNPDLDNFPLYGLALESTVSGGSQFLYSTGSAWEPSSELDTLQLDGIGFAFSSLVIGQTLVYNGVHWINQAVGNPTVSGFGTLNPTGTTSSSYVFMGIGSTVKFTPATTGKLLVSIRGYVAAGGTDGTVFVEFGYGTGTAPANGTSAASWTQIGAAEEFESIVSSIGFVWSIQLLVTGLSVSTAYWFDFKLKGPGTITVSIANVFASIWESS